MLGITNRAAVLDRAGIVHATEESAQLKLVPAPKRGRRWARRTLDAVCGKQRLRPYFVRVMRSDGESDVYLMPWPPRIRALDPMGELRCRACFEVTGKPRPAPEWDNLSPSSSKTPRGQG